MAELYDLKEVEEKVVLIAVRTSEEDDTEACLDELEELVKTAGAVTVAKVIQNREKVHPGTYLGKGKIEEVREMVWELGATGVVCDDELSPAQLRNLEDALETKVMDRTMVILDIFAARANTREGKIQVELAQLKYRAARLVGLRNSLSRLGGGIGTRGPGEKKLEMDRRLIHDRIGQLKEELKDVERHREVQRQQREKAHTQVAAIVGYTNAGKSTLLNHLTDAGILAEDKLFATLDPTTRSLKLPSGQEILLTDTVGFIRNLPHHLIKAFRSTLEEAALADVILHVCDASGAEFADELKITDDLLTELGASGKPVLLVFNKCDLIADGEQKMLLKRIADQGGCESVFISAKTGEGMEEFTEKLERIASEGRSRAEFLIPYSDGGAVNLLHALAHDVQTEYVEDGVRVIATVDAKTRGKLKEYLIVPENTACTEDDEEDW